MRILVVAPFVPWPLAHGGRIRLFHLVRELARHHEVTLACLADGPAPDLGPLPGFCREVVTVARPHPLAAFGRFLLGPDPYNVARFRSATFLARLRELTARTPFDLVHLETTLVWPCATACGDVPRVLGTQNVEYRILAQLGNVCANPLKRLLYRVETSRMRRFEEEAWRSADLCLTVSDQERSAVVAAGADPGRVVTVPNGVDPERFRFTPRPGGKRLLFLGGVDYLPNLDAARWLLGEVWPLVRVGEPSAELLVAGRGTEQLTTGGMPAGVTCLGDPEDVPACFAAADGLLVPLRVGGGTRLKVLEAMAAGLPVVATAKGCEGTAAVAGEHLLVADTPAGFAAAALRLLAEPALATTLAANARALVVERYSWERLVAGLEIAITDLGSRRERKST